MDKPIEIHFGGEHDKFVALKVLGYTHPGCTDYWDGNWVRTAVSIAVGGFSGNISGDFRVEELQSFLGELKRLYKEHSGTALFTTLEDQLEIKVSINKLGQISFTGFATDSLSTEGSNTLSFAFDTDQTYLLTPIKQLEKTLSRFPMRGQKK